MAYWHECPVRVAENKIREKQYLQAAEWIDSFRQDYICETVGLPIADPVHERFSSEYPGVPGIIFEGMDSREKWRSMRVLLLCFAAAMAEAGDL